MYKSRLQELCQQRLWDFPSYSSSRDGPDHRPQFKASVLVNGVSFDSPDFCKSSKEAQNEAARIAFEHFSLPVSTPSSSSVVSSSSSSSPSKGTSDVQYPYKSQLLTYAQKRCLSLPSYSCKREGSDHAPLFRALVTVDGQTFESPNFCRTLKEAEHAAAEVAFLALSKADLQEDDFSLYKNLLQDLTQKEGLSIPVFTTTISGASHAPTFTSTVEVEGAVFQGVSKTKKQAEMNAAKAAFCSLEKRKPSRISLPAPCQSGVAQEAPISSNFSRQSTISVESQQELNLRCISNLTPIVTSEKNTDGGSGSAETILEEVNTNVDQTPPNSKTGFERVEIPVRAPVRSSTEYGASSPTTVLDCHESLGREAHGNLSATEVLLYDRFMVYPRKPDMKFPEGATVLPISDDDYIAVGLDDPN